MPGPIVAALLSAGASQLASNLLGGDKQQIQSPDFSAPQFNSQSWERLMSLLYNLPSGSASSTPIAFDQIYDAYGFRRR